jgi:HAE1 family hydrophobic/amphiphilic exporter-1
MDSKNLSDVLRNAVKQRLSRIPGVGTIEFVGDQEREIQVSLDAGSLRARGIVAGQVVAALSREFISVPAGSLKNDGSNISINVSGKSSVIEKLGEIAVVRYPDGSVVKLSEVAVIHDGVKDMASKSMVNGRSAVIVKIFKQSNANTVEVSELCRAELQKIERD